MRPIQKRLLIHEITYIEEVKNEFNEVEDSKSTIVKFVRVEPSETYVQLVNGDKIMSSDIIFWDGLYSTPCKFEKGQKIIFNNKTTVIQKINYIYDDKKLHHLEILVI